MKELTPKFSEKLQSIFPSTSENTLFREKLPSFILKKAKLFVALSGKINAVFIHKSKNFGQEICSILFIILICQSVSLGGRYIRRDNPNGY